MNLPQIPLDQIDLSDPEFWTKPRDWRFGAYKTLRDESPFHFFPERQVENSPIPPGPGYRALTRHDDVWFDSQPHF